MSIAWLRSLVARKPLRTIRRSRRPAARPWLEQLERRDLLSANAAIDAAYGQMPLSFEINAGQSDHSVNFLAHGQGYGIFLTPSAAVLTLSNSSGTGATATTTSNALRMNLVGGNSTATVSGLERQEGVSNYLIGNDPSQWHANIANYGKVAYHGVYQGIDLVYYGNQRRLEYDFVVSPGADANQIHLTMEGSTGLALDSAGNLVVHTSGGDLGWAAPVLYQDSAAGRQSVSGHFVVSGTQVSFAVGAYDHSRPLVIDPTLAYSTYLGGNSSTNGTGIAADSAGNAYVTGGTQATNFPTTNGYQSRLLGTQSAFVTKLNPSLSGAASLLYSTYLGGNSTTDAAGIAVDSAGRAFVTGFTDASNFPTTSGAYQISNPNPGGASAFVTKLNPSLSGTTSLVYSTYLGGNDFTFGNGIAVDSAGNAIVTGETRAPNFPTSPGAFQTSNPAPAGSYSAFVSKFINASQSTLSSSSNPSVVGQAVTFTDTVTSPDTGGPASGGSVTFTIDGTPTTVPLGAGGTASVSQTFTTVSTHSVSASYSGSSSSAGSNSTTLTQQVQQASTTTTLAPAPASPSRYGQPVTFTITVAASAPGSGTPTGTVSLTDGGTIIATGVLSGGSASFTISSLALGNHTLQAQYAGTADYQGSSSATQTYTVNPAPTMTTLTSSANPSSMGQSVTFTATVSSSVGTLTGSVTFADNGTQLGVVTLNNGTATLSTSALTVDSHTITAVFTSSSANFAGSSATPLTQVVQAPPPRATAIFAVGADAGGVPEVKVYNADGSLRMDFLAYDSAFRGGVTVSTGDIDGDGIPEIITGAGPGGGPHVKVFSGADGHLITSFMAYNSAFTGGVFVAAGALDAAPRLSIITGAGPGGGPHVRSWYVSNGVAFQRPGPLGSFMAYDAAFTGGVHVAAGLVEPGSIADIVTGAGAGGGPHVKVFSGATGALLESFFAYDPGFQGGVAVAAGGSGRTGIVTGAGAGGGPHVKWFQGLSQTPAASFMAYTVLGTLTPNSGVRVDAFTSGNSTSSVRIVTALGAGQPPLVKVFDAVSLAELNTFFAFDPAFTSGVNVG